MSDEREDSRALFLQELQTIERAIRFASRRASLPPEEADDFGSWVMLKLIEDDYAVLARHDRRSSFAAFISVVVHRLLLDYRIAQWGKWHASAKAKRMGEPAITIESLLHRDGRSIDEVFPLLLRRWPELTREQVDAIAGELPMRLARPRAVDVELAENVVDASTLDEPIFMAERVLLARRIESVVRAALDELDAEQRLLLRLRFEGGMSVAGISRMLHIEQKPIYRRIQHALAALRVRLQRLGIGAEEVEEVLSCRFTDLDLGFEGNLDGRASSDEEHS